MLVFTPDRRANASVRGIADAIVFAGELLTPQVKQVV
jgi:hypothetical protein